MSQASPRFVDNYNEEDSSSPAFLTLGQKYSIAIGSTVVLPCKINETGTFYEYTKNLSQIREGGEKEVKYVRAIVIFSRFGTCICRGEPIPVRPIVHPPSDSNGVVFISSTLLSLHCMFSSGYLFFFSLGFASSLSLAIWLWLVSLFQIVYGKGIRSLRLNVFACKMKKKRIKVERKRLEDLSIL